VLGRSLSFCCGFWGEGRLKLGVWNWQNGNWIGIQSWKYANGEIGRKQNS
jgi:hypothetical protein